MYPDGALIEALAEFWNVPEGYYAEPIGKARTLRIGEGAGVATIVSWGTMLLESAIAAARFADAHKGALVEVIDLRTLMPFDEEAILQSVARTNRVIIATEEVDLTSFGRHLYAWITQHLFWDLDNPAILLSAVAAPAAPYNEGEESEFFPKADDIQRALEQLARE
jgi:pyruvate/2-oxoglutarate/acetoin dehydrogenase E1 component